MESLNPSCSSSDEKKLKKPFASLLRYDSSPAKASLSDEISTPEKPAQLPRRAGKRSLAFSVNDVRRIAMGLQGTRNEPTDMRDLAGSGDEKQRPSRSYPDSAPKSSAARNTVKLPEKYEILTEFFNSLDSSIRLLRLKGTMSTFKNISASIQHLTERRFTYRHLAQMKHIFPEAISIKKVLLHDATTCCMKPELQVSLQVDTVESNFELKGESAYSALRKVFKARIVKFAREHPEEDDIPEETLPHPYGQTKPIVSTESNQSSCSMLTRSLPAAHPLQQSTALSHFPISFQRRFTQRTNRFDAMGKIASLNEVTTKDDSFAPTFPSLTKFASKPSFCKKSPFLSPGPKPSSSYHQRFKEDSKELISAQGSPSRGTLASETTPAKGISTPARLMTITPELQTPKRSRDLTTNDTQKELVKRATRIKLFATPRKNVKSYDEENLSENLRFDDVIGFLPESLLQDIRDKERHSREERDAGAEGARLRKKVIASLPRLFDTILLIFQSGNRSVITRQELVHKILSSHCSIVDKKEVEEQLELLEELVPDWISGKTVTSGDFIYCVNKMSSSQQIRQRLAVAE